jgi:hypothetical protein
MQRAFYICLGFLLAVFIIELAGFKESATTSSPVKETAQTPVHAVEMPEQANFAGEAVPLDDPEVYERLDRELLVNTYWHSHTFLHIKRANRWFPVIEKVLEEEGMPEDFKYMAVAESSLDNSAVSPQGAEGMWQFRKGTARDLGLTVNKHVDERYHVEKATRAACQYLKKAKEKFGSWTLAAASYNVGKNAIKKQLKRQQADNYYDLFLNTETGRFVFRIVAIKQILQSPEKYGFKVSPEQKYPPYKYKTLRIDSTIPDLADFAVSHKITYKELKKLNPWLLKSKLKVSEGDTFAVKLPLSSE